MHPIVILAKGTVEMFVQAGKTPVPPADLPEDLPPRAGSFVTIHLHGKLRGCIGTIEPTRATLAEEVIGNAVSAASRDPRFPPITPEELPELEFKVDVLFPPEEIEDESSLDPSQYGVIVSSRRNPAKRGLLLPDLPGVDSVEHQVSVARRKAWLDAREPYRLQRFRVDRFE